MLVRRKKSLVIQNSFGYTRSVEKGILQYLGEEKKAKSRDILDYLKKNGAEYTRMGLCNILKKLIEEKIIKIDKKGKATTYFLTKDHYDDTDYLGEIFAQHASKKLFQIPFQTYDSKSKHEIILDEFIKRIGVYTIFTELYSWKLTENKKKNSERTLNQDKWLHASKYLQNLSTEFFKELSKLASNSEQVDYKNRYSNYSEKILQVNQLNIVLKRKFPKEVAVFEQVLKDISKFQKSDKKIKQEIEQEKKYKKWKNNLIQKAKRNPKVKLGINECPICHYDGKLKIKSGPLKGRIFPTGFYMQYESGHMEFWYCQCCQHSEQKIKK